MTKPEKLASEPEVVIVERESLALQFCIYNGYCASDAVAVRKCSSGNGGVDSRKVCDLTGIPARFTHKLTRRAAVDRVSHLARVASAVRAFAG